MLRKTIGVVLVMLVFMAAAGISTYFTINLLIRSEDTVVVPELTGKEVVHTLELLTDLGLNTKVKGSEYNDEVPKHHVISQDPEPGSEIKKGRDVRIVISKGARVVILPNLVGMRVPQARILLEENDLRQGRLSYVYDHHLNKEEILAQYPLAGASGMRDNDVDLLISAGPAPNITPMVDLKGMNLNQAIKTIEKHRLTIGTIQSIQDVTIANDIVVDHNPASGYPVILGNAVNFTINRHTQDAADGPKNEVLLFRHRAAQGFLKQRIRVRLNRPAAAVDIFNAFVRPGKEIWLMVPTDAPATLLLYVDDELVKTVQID